MGDARDRRRKQCQLTCVCSLFACSLFSCCRCCSLLGRGRRTPSSGPDGASVTSCRRTPLPAAPRSTSNATRPRAASKSTHYEVSESSDFRTIAPSRGRGVRARARGSPAACCRGSLGRTGARRTTSSASNSPLRAPFVHLLLFGGKDRFVAAALQRLFRRLLRVCMHCGHG